MVPREVIREYRHPTDGSTVPVSVLHPLLEVRKTLIYRLMGEMHGTAAPGSPGTDNPITVPLLPGWNEDVSNQGRGYKRNQIRLDVVPALLQVTGNPESLYE